MQLVYEIIALASLIALSGFFSGLEVALVGVRRSKVHQMLNEKLPGSKSLHKLKSNPSRMMASVNLGNNLVNVAATALATDIALNVFGDQGLAIVIGVMTFLILVFGEITPKTYCNANAPKIALKYSRVLLAFSYVLYPIVLMFEKITKGIINLTGSDQEPPRLTEEEIKGVIEQGLQDKAIEKQESELVHGALNFDDIVIRSVMTPRTKMFPLNSKTMLFEALPQINQCGFSRIPLHGNNKDEIIGIIHVRDVLKALENDKKTSRLEMISRKPVFVSQEKMVSDLLKEMQGRQTHMAIVIDEFGGVEGCVTLEDLLEEIVGEIKDEKDTEQQIFQNDGSNAIITNGDIEIDTINEIFKTDLSAGDDYSQLNGLLHEQLHDIPKEGDKLEINSLRIIVEKVSKNKPERVKIEKIK